MWTNYLAHSPFQITWALDSNVYACTYGSAQAFLDDALARDLWGFDIATANQRDGPMYPHNFNLVYRWSPRTSVLMRDWLLLQMRRGLDSDDQKTLFFAQTRQVAAGGLAVGQVATPYAGAFYPVVRVRAKNTTDAIRISRVVRGPVHVVHTRSASDCSAFNEHSDKERQLVQIAHRPPGAKRSTVIVRSALSLDECEQTLAGYGLAESLVTFRGGNGPAAKNRTRQLCLYRDVGPRYTEALLKELAQATLRKRNSSNLNATLTALRFQLKPRDGFHSYYTSSRPLPLPANLEGHISWPPIFKPSLEALNISKHFGIVDIEN